MTTYYKATRPDGTDFYTGTVDYAAALSTGEPVAHASFDRKGGASSYLSVSTSAADCTGFRWPCRLFRVEPVGRAYKVDGLPNKRAVRACRVAEELPSWQAFGPNGEAVVAILDRLATVTPGEAARLRAARAAAGDAARDAAWDAAWAAAWDAAWAAARAAAGDAARDAAWAAAGDAARDAAWAAARDAAWDAAWAAAWDAAWAAARAEIVRDLITPEQYDTLTGLWRSVMGG